MNASMKKFKGKLAICAESGEVDSGVAKTESTLLSEEVETTLVANGWKKPLKRSHSSPTRAYQTKRYLGTKNPLGKDRRPIKCYSCKYEHRSACTCPCLYHLADHYPFFVLYPGIFP